MESAFTALKSITPGAMLQVAAPDGIVDTLGLIFRNKGLVEDARKWKHVPKEHFLKKFA